jgi:hypothetical protein
MARQRDDELSLSLFPFLGVFVCVIGVYAFLDIFLFLSTRSVVVRSSRSGESRHRHPFLIDCRGEQLQLQAPAWNHQAMAAVDSSDVPEIARRMQRRTAPFTVPLTSLAGEDNSLRTLLKDLVALNNHATQKGLPYEGYLVLGVAPDGVGCYWKVDEQLQKHPSLAVSVVALLPGWSLKQANGGGGHGAP